ncbi:MAG: bifunctional phosphopantothenoylcysteine decarboxylase/phosphopantothenate--cysteine ligase CoaBC [Cellvibrionales bacterium]|nr:bifunctional phosphopantothenoylcysteine decarboxylase/phosphopantothenate--cysteine ligase CoaBC [Cellvibrionales bacterium]
MTETTPRPRLHRRRILLGVTGGIASYKSADLVRRLIECGAEVRVVMTAGAQAFVQPLTFQALSGNPVHTDLLDPAAEAAMGHIELARWAERVLIAPASANFIERLAQGRGDDLLATLCLATQAPIQLAPAMNQAMWANPAVCANVRQLQERGIGILGPASGAQACGDHGAGRMLEPLEILELVAATFAIGLLSGKKVLLTAGPTREPIDPVRYLSNHSSGQMGYALAAAAAAAGGEVVLVSGPVCLEAPARVRRVMVESVADMLAAVKRELAGADLFIACAAVADYRPAQAARQKIKKHADRLHLELVKNPDILHYVGQRSDKPFTVGFAAESEKLLENARAKLAAKKADMIVANDIARQDIGFGSADNEVHLLSTGAERRLPKAGKTLLAKQLIEAICARWLGTAESGGGAADSGKVVQPKTPP